jgi:hypothetical protein
MAGALRDRISAGRQPLNFTPIFITLTAGYMVDSCTRMSFSILFPARIDHVTTGHCCGSCGKFREVYRMLKSSISVNAVVLETFRRPAAHSGLFVPVRRLAYG